MTYKLIKKDSDFVVIEKDTDQVVYSRKVRDEAYSVYKKLQGGCGFRGCTPAFFLKTPIVKKEEKK